MPCICAIAGAIPPDYVDASYSAKTEKKASVDAEGNFDPKPVETTKSGLFHNSSYFCSEFQNINDCPQCVCDCSTIIPERLDPFINKYAEYTHDKWAFEKVTIKSNE